MSAFWRMPEEKPSPELASSGSIPLPQPQPKID
jgi:hypothetical protein